MGHRLWAERSGDRSNEGPRAAGYGKGNERTCGLGCRRRSRGPPTLAGKASPNSGGIVFSMSGSRREPDQKILPARRAHQPLIARCGAVVARPHPETRGWWARQDSNLGPTDYEPAALTAELRARNARLPDRVRDVRACGPYRAVSSGPGGQAARARQAPLNRVNPPTPPIAYVRPSRNALSLRDLDGWRSFRSALASI